MPLGKIKTIQNMYQRKFTYVSPLFTTILTWVGQISKGVFHPTLIRKKVISVEPMWSPQNMKQNTTIQSQLRRPKCQVAHNNIEGMFLYWNLESFSLGHFFFLNSRHSRNSWMLFCFLTSKNSTHTHKKKKKKKGEILKLCQCNLKKGY